MSSTLKDSANEWRARLAAVIQQLAQRDPVLAPIIAEHGPCRITPHDNYYQALIDAIVSQQLSVKAAASIEGKLQRLFGGRFPTPREVLTREVDILRSVGLSRAKAAYIQDLARHIEQGSLDIAGLPSLSNEEIIRELTAVKGIGEWTAHMFLIFSLGRLDVLPVGDLGIRSGIRKLYGFAELPTAAEIQALAAARHWRPYESVASWYIWQSLNNQPGV